MLDQSFSLDNFKTIFEIENRKGKFQKEYFSTDFHDAAVKLSNKRNEIKEYRKKEVYCEDDFKKLMAEKRELEERKNQLLERDLFEISNGVNKIDFSFNISAIEDPITKKIIYPIRKDALSFFAMKQLQNNIYNTFKVKQANRYQIVNQVKKLLQDNFPKYIVRTDIKGFYENVSQEKLLKLIEENPLLSPKSKYLINDILFHYNILTGQLGKDRKRGIPRGAGVSAYLAELYMRNIDKTIKDLQYVSFYGRYVDDIIVFFTPKTKEKPAGCYLKQIEEIVIEEDLELKVDVDPHINKTYQYDIFNNKANYIINFLGYKFEIENGNYKNIYLSDNKKDKYRLRIEKSIDAFLAEYKHNYKEAKRLLIHRLNYLTKNARLERPKKGLIGIFYSNSLIEKNCPCLDELNLALYQVIDAKLPLINFPKLNGRLKRFDFKKGFCDKLFFNINSKKKEKSPDHRSKYIPDLRSPKMKGIKALQNNYERIIEDW